MTSGQEYSESGQPIYRYAEPTHGWRPAGGESHIEQICAHLDRYVGDADWVWHEIVSDTVHLDVHHVPPRPERNFHTLYTTGMSDLPMPAPAQAAECRYAELLLCLPPEWPVSQEQFTAPDTPWYWPVETLKYVARFPHVYQAWLWNGHTIPNGDPPQPLGPGTQLSGIVLLPPLLMPVEAHQLRVRPDKTVHFFGLVPLYREEMDYKLKHGLSALTDRLDETSVTELLDPRRKNVCKRGFWPFGRG